MPHRPFPLLFLRLLSALFFIAASALSTGVAAQINLKTGAQQDSSRVRTPYVQAELVAHAPDGVAPGKPLWLGLLLQHQPHWHSYWHNPGDSGLPTQLQWQLPAGLDVGDIAWPVPRKLPLGKLVNFGYEGQVLLAVPVTVTPAFAPGPLAHTLNVQLHASWLVCRQECIPEEGQSSLQLPLQGSTASPAALFERTLAQHPRPLPLAPGSQATLSDDGQRLQLRLQGLPPALHGQELALFPEDAGWLHNAGAITQSWQGDVWTAQLPISPERSASPEPLALLLALGEQGWRVQLPLQGPWPALAPAATLSPALEAALRANAAVPAAPTPPAAAPLGSWLLALGGALLGGLILNLMPCVFPVLAIKVAGFARHAQDQRLHRMSGLAYTAGVLASFLALGALMLALRAAGEAVGWGFQLQSPAVVAALALLFTLIGLNLAGLYEFGRMLPSSLAGLQLRHPVLDAFFTGVLAVAIASPCTAPFMGASLGLTAQLPAPQALGIFAALGLGLALPYLLASWWPALARALPRPGAWMQTLRRFLAFPMFATVVWLLWVLGQQTGIDGASALLALLLLVALLAWTLTLRGRTRLVLATLSIAASAWWISLSGPKIIELQPPQASASTPAPGWQAWQPGLPEQLLAQGQPVFVDYTAAWCVTCQVNKQTTLHNPEVLADFAAHGVALLRADWTRRDPAITAELARLGRSGVPVYTLQAPGGAPLVLTELLSRHELRAALAQLARP
ncbi:MAG: thioredoxin family protein [Comamonadaceae bacterium]|nr:thioredoxin family protein [Comamonadaceae bacterium]